MNNYYPTLALNQVEQTMRHKGLEYPALELKYNEKTAILSKTLVFSASASPRSRLPGLIPPAAPG